jgi:hypothetical protein
LICDGLSQFDSLDAIHEQDGDRRPTDSGSPVDPAFILQKVILPFLTTRVEELYDDVCRRIHPGQIGALVEIAMMARQREIGVVIAAAVLSRTDMLNVKWKDQVVSFVNAAILATPCGPRTYKLTSRLIHLREAEELSRFRALA